MSPGGPRAGWHRPAGLVPIAYLAAIAAVGFAHPLVPYPAWLLIHLLLLGAATNAIVMWSAHFAAAILRTPPAPTRRGEAGRLIGLNAGVLAVLAGGAVGPAWLGVAGAAVIFTAIAAHLAVLAQWLRRALPARFTIVVRYYLAAGVALLLGIPAGAWMLMVDDAARPRIVLFHAHIANGMYGAVVIDPPDLAPVDREYLLVQSEFYPPESTSAPTKTSAETPEAVTFNGFVSQYAFRPLAAQAGERIRIWVLDAGPNRSSAFHLVGAPFDTMSVEGAYRLRPTDPGGAQVLDLAPASGGFVETVLPQAGSYPFLTHALVDADRGARGTIQVAP